jgi:hypothetical protein
MSGGGDGRFYAIQLHPFHVSHETRHRITAAGCLEAVLPASDTAEMENPRLHLCAHSIF